MGGCLMRDYLTIHFSIFAVSGRHAEWRFRNPVFVDFCRKRRILSINPGSTDKNEAETEFDLLLSARKLDCFCLFGIENWYCFCLLHVPTLFTNKGKISPQYPFKHHDSIEPVGLVSVNVANFPVSLVWAVRDSQTNAESAKTRGSTDGWQNFRCQNIRSRNIQCGKLGPGTFGPQNIRSGDNWVLGYSVTEKFQGSFRPEQTNQDFCRIKTCHIPL